MTEQLKHLREALRRVKYEAASLADAQVIALEALTAAQPAQEVAAVNTREQTFQNGYRIGYQAGRASLPTQPAAQATPEPQWETSPKDGEQWETTPKAPTPEPVGEVVGWRYKIPTHGGGTAWTHTRPQTECLIEEQPLYTHPAPGVPEVLIQQVMEALRDGLSVCESVQVSRDRKISREGCALYAQTEEWCRWLDAEVGPKIRAALDALAAAQAKGGDHG